MVHSSSQRSVRVRAFQTVAAAYVAALSWFVPSLASAGPFDVVGGSSESIALSGAVAASAEGPDAAFYNPAGLAAHGHREIAVGYSRLASALTLDLPSGPRGQDIRNPDYIYAGVALPVDRFSFGLGTIVLPTTLVEAIAHRPDAAFYPWFENRSQRLVIMPAAAWRPYDWLSFGISGTFFAGLGGVAQAHEGPSRATEVIIVERIGAEAAVALGARVRPIPELTFGLTYRQAFSVPYRTVVTSDVGGIDVGVTVAANALVTPHTLVLGSSLELGDARVNLDLSYYAWRAAPPPFVDVTARVSGISLAPVRLGPTYQDTFRIAAGFAYDVRASDDVTVALRVGGFFEPSIVGAQTGRTNLIDGTKISGSLGAGVTIARVLPRPFRIDAHFATIGSLTVSHDKRFSTIEQAATDPYALADDDNMIPGDQTANPGYPRVGGGGAVFNFGLTLTMEVAP